MKGPYISRRTVGAQVIRLPIQHLIRFIWNKWGLLLANHTSDPRHFEDVQGKCFQQIWITLDSLYPKRTHEIPLKIRHGEAMAFESHPVLNGLVGGQPALFLRFGSPSSVGVCNPTESVRPGSQRCPRDPWWAPWTMGRGWFCWVFFSGKLENSLWNIIVTSLLCWHL